MAPAQFIVEAVRMAGNNQKVHSESSPLTPA
jgi:hypothetical protein